MCLEMDSRKWKILGFFICQTEGGGGGLGPGGHLSHFFFFFEAFPNASISSNFYFVLSFCDIFVLFNPLKSFPGKFYWITHLHF